MNVQTITVDPEVAQAKLREFRGIALENRRKEDADFRRLYRAASAGKPILDVAAAIKLAGLSDAGYPRLALARAPWKEVYFHPYGHYFADQHWPLRGKKHCIYLPQDALYWDKVTKKDIFSPVPFLPPALRPKDDLENYHILFEVISWQEYPSDPYLLRQIAGWLFVVVAEWDLTPLERSLLKNRRIN